jgi:hypothetical protein
MEDIMSVERVIRLFAGVLILVSLALGWVVSPYWYLVTAFVGLNLSQSSLTGFCPLEMMLDKMKVGQLTSNAGV